MDFVDTTGMHPWINLLEHLSKRIGHTSIIYEDHHILPFCWFWKQQDACTWHVIVVVAFALPSQGTRRTPCRGRQGDKPFVAATGYEDGSLLTDYEGAKEVVVGDDILHLNGERDTDSPSFITLSEPTGISARDYNRRTYTIAIIVSGIILAAGIVVIKKKLTK